MLKPLPTNDDAGRPVRRWRPVNSQSATVTLRQRRMWPSYGRVLSIWGDVNLVSQRGVAVKL